MTEPPVSRRRKFLVVVDKTPECRVALRYSARRAEHTMGVVTLLHVIEPAEFQHWSSVERIMQEEAHKEAEAVLHAAARVVNELTGLTPEVVIREGNKAAELLGLLREDRDISILVLAAGTGKEGPGPLVSALAGEAPGAYPIPVTIVPGGLSDAEVDALG